jgi:hypothetical protein
LKLLQFGRSEPADVGSVPGRQGLAGDSSAEKVDEHIVIEGPCIATARNLAGWDNAVKDPEQIGGVYHKAGFFQGLALGALPQGFAEFEHPARNGPFTQQGSLAAFDQQNAFVFDNDCAHSHQRLLGVFTLHKINLPQEMQKSEVECNEKNFRLKISDCQILNRRNPKSSASILEIFTLKFKIYNLRF